MKLLYSAMCILAATAMSCTVNRVTPSADIATFEIDAKTVNAIDASASIKVIYTQSPKTQIVVDAPDNLTDHLDIKVKDGCLTAGLKSNLTINGSSNVIVHVSSPAIHNVDMSSAASLEIPQGITIDGKLDIEASTATGVAIAGLKANTVDIECSSSAQVSISGIEADNVEAEAASAAQITLAGQCKTVDYEASSAATINAAGLSAESGTAKASSAASVNSHVTNLRRTASSGGQINN